MNQFFICLFAIIFPLSVFAQVVAIQNDQENILYVGCPNHVTVAVEGLKESSIELTISSGRIVSNNSLSSGRYDIWVDKAGIDTIFVKKILKNGRRELIHSAYYRVKYLPKPKAYINGISNGKITQTSLLIAIAPIAPNNFHYYDGNHIVMGYTIAIYRKRKEIYRKTITDSNGAKIDSVTNHFFYNVRNNDKVVFKDIAIRVPGYTYTDTEPIELTVIDAHKYRKLKKPVLYYVEDPITGQQIPKTINYKKVR